MGKEDRAAGWGMAFDLNANGQTEISKDEAVALHAKVFTDAPQETIDEWWSTVDQNSDGKLSREEFIKFASEHHEQYKLNPISYMRSLPIDMRMSERQLTKETV